MRRPHQSQKHMELIRIDARLANNGVSEAKREEIRAAIIKKPLAEMVEFRKNINQAAAQ